MFRHCQRSFLYSTKDTENLVCITELYTIKSFVIFQNENPPIKEEEKNEVVPKILNDDEERDKKVSNFLDDIKSAATEGWIQQMGMIYEPTSGMYYHPTTGYYYNAVR